MDTTQSNNLAATCERLHRDHLYLEKIHQELENTHRELEKAHQELQRAYQAAVEENRQLSGRNQKQEMQIWQMQLEIEAQRQEIVQLSKKKTEV